MKPFSTNVPVLDLDVPDARVSACSLHPLDLQRFAAQGLPTDTKISLNLETSMDNITIELTGVARELNESEGTDVIVLWGKPRPTTSSNPSPWSYARACLDFGKRGPDPNHSFCMLLV